MNSVIRRIKPSRRVVDESIECTKFIAFRTRRWHRSQASAHVRVPVSAHVEQQLSACGEALEAERRDPRT